ncbi:hypothetical protein NXV73_11435 [Bacteroides salyersiae]|nr:hypothetical protein [Bacteroides salyersiae]
MAAPLLRDEEGVKMVTHEPIVVSRQENGLKIGNREFDVEFSAVSGEMISLKYKGEEMLLAGLQPNFWRPSIDNDVPSGLLSRCIGWKEPMKNSKLLKLDMQVEPDSSLVIVVADYYLQERGICDTDDLSYFGEWYNKGRDGLYTRK